MFVRNHRRVGKYLAAYWQTTDFSAKAILPPHFKARERFTLRVIQAGMIAQVLAGLVCIYFDLFGSFMGGWQFGLATIVAYPLVWAHLLPLAAGLWWLTRPKALGRALLCALLEAQVRRLRKRHAFKVVAVAGSVGKTSTKIAIAHVLQASQRVQWQEGNYNDRVTVPLIFFGHNEPGIFNVPAWLNILRKNEQLIRKPYPYDVVVAELGTDGPGFMAEFAYVRPDVAVVTAITPEHMEYFGTLDAVAQEELTILHFAKRTLLNSDDTPAAYLVDRDYTGYGLDKQAPYHATLVGTQTLQGQQVRFTLAQGKTFEATIPLLGNQGAKIALAAAAAADMLDVPLPDIQKGIAAVTAFAGRMQILPGIKGSTIIDDTYNASPVAVQAALDVLQRTPAPQRIAILGSMNELGDYSPQAHREMADYCDPAKLDMVIALGPDAVEYFAPAARAKGCTVETFLDPYKAGAFVKALLKDNAVILAKGSQNRVFAEESLKVLLATKADQ
ncbi:MAG TPA: UDP-N-acetylmuramoyl-tripeptide--D-alanyl-D-alanine ligase, partial [Candidatus Saccharimonadales bacterium]|nr:UDP-N-acetylmuramoyl-tripeptide--D-alanyl-D-alanine ligase [Candidatus Saccharimonadales bacterium]